MQARFLVAWCAILTVPSSALGADARPPTATEIFHLRSECAALGEKILENNVVGSALAQSQVSHYEPRTNRCYVELTVQTADLTKPQDTMDRFLYDGQTGEMLAVARIGKGKRHGMVYDKQHEPDYSTNDAGFGEASAYIDDRMADDRKR